MSVPTITPTYHMTARITGFAYLAMFFLAMFANFFVIDRLIEPTDAAATFRNIAGSETLFRAGAVTFLCIAILDILIAWALHLLLRAAGNEVSRLAAWFRLAYSALLVVSVVFLYVAGRLVSGADAWQAVDQAQLNAYLALTLDGFTYAWLVGLALFGLHLMLIGALVLRSGIAPKPLGALLVAAGAAYLTDTLAQGLLSDYASYEGIFLIMVAVPSMLGELGFTWWLLARAGRVDPAPGERILPAPA